VFTSTPNEYRAVSHHVGQAGFARLACSVIECGAGRINASFAAARELAAKEAAGKGQPIIVGTGTSGSLSMDLRQGEVIVSNSAVISDWRMEDGDAVTLSPYGQFDYRHPDPGHVERMAIECRDGLILGLLERLPRESFRQGRLLTSEAFVAGKDNKLAKGAAFGALACDMESGVYAHIGNRLANVPWLNVRVVADTLDESLGDYFAMERGVTDILGAKVAETLKILESLL
jgi:nucleoside phosphorylase